MADIVQRADVGMIEGGDDARFTLETGTKLVVNDLDGDRAAQARIHRTKDLAQKHGKSQDRISQLRREYHDDWQQFTAAAE